jgi:cytochrome c-type biogenesis protein CcmH/NrfG
VQKKQDDAPTWELLGKVYSVLSMNDDANKAFEKADKIRNK